MGYDLEQQCRAQAVEQELLDNARVLWNRHVEYTRLDVEEHAEQLRLLASLAALVAGFSMTAFVQFTFCPTLVPISVLLGFGITNAITVVLFTCVMAMCSLILASTFRTYTTLLSPEEEAHFVLQCREFARQYVPGDRPPQPRRTFHAHWDFFCEAEWERTLIMFSTGLFTLLANLVFSGFIKFVFRAPASAQASLSVMGCPQPESPPGSIQFRDGVLPAILLAAPLGLGGVYYLAAHLRWVRHLISRKQATAEAHLEPSGLPFDWHLPQRPVELPLAAGLKPATSWGPEWVHGPASVTTDSLGRQWLAEDMEQQVLNNARLIWKRFADKQRNDVEERAEQLRSFGFLSGIVAGFAVAALLQLQFDPRDVKDGIQVCYALAVGGAAALPLCSMAMCTLILLSILKTEGSLVSEEEEARFMMHCREFAQRYAPGDRPPRPVRNFRNHWEARCEGEWHRALVMFSAGLVCFMLIVVFAAWIKYQPFTVGVATPVTVTAIVAAGLGYLLVVHGRWVRHLTGHHTTTASSMEALLHPAGLPFDWHLPGRAPARPAKPPTRLSSVVDAIRFSSVVEAISRTISSGLHRASSATGLGRVSSSVAGVFGSMWAKDRHAAVQLELQPAAGRNVEDKLEMLASLRPERGTLPAVLETHGT